MEQTQKKYTVKSGNLEELNQYKKFRYPRLSLQLIHGHNVAGSKPVQLDEVIVTQKKEK